MNIDNVRYPLFLCKHKNHAWEIVSRNVETLPASELERCYFAITKETNAAKSIVVRARQKELAAIMAAEADSSAQQLELPLNETESQS